MCPRFNGRSSSAENTRSEEGLREIAEIVEKLVQGRPAEDNAKRKFEHAEERMADLKAIEQGRANLSHQAGILTQACLRKWLATPMHAFKPQPGGGSGGEGEGSAARVRPFRALAAPHHGTRHATPHAAPAPAPGPHP